MMQTPLFDLAGVALAGDKASTDTSNDWYTPPPIVSAARATLGGTIDTDPASCAAAQAVVQATTWYGIADDGLTQPWYGNVWVNPPYSEPLPWVRRFIAHCGEHRGIMLVNLACSPEWAELLWSNGTSMCLFSDRLPFWHPDRPRKSSYDRDNMAVFIGSGAFYFRKHFEPFGRVVDL